jgi:hypothetical protein
MVRYTVWPEGDTSEAVTVSGRWACEWAVFKMGNRELWRWLMSGFADAKLPRRICCQWPVDNGFEAN